MQVFLTMYDLSIDNKHQRVKSFLHLNWILTKETSSQLFSCQYCEIFKNIFFNRTPPVAASIKWFIDFTYWKNLLPQKLNSGPYLSSSLLLIYPDEITDLDIARRKLAEYLQVGNLIKVYPQNPLHGWHTSLVFRS